MRYFILFLTLFFFNLTIGQVSNEYAAIDKKISVIPDSLTTSTSKIASYINSKFTTESEKVRAAFFLDIECYFLRCTQYV